MTNQMELAAEERSISGKQVKQLRKKGVVPANMFGHDRPSVSVQVNMLALQKLLAHGGKNVVLKLKLGDRPAVPVLIRHVQYNPISGAIEHVDFYMVNATEKLRSQIRLHFVNDSGAAGHAEVLVQRPLNEVTVECLPADLPSTIQVDLSLLSEVDMVIRVGDLPLGPGVTMVTDPNELVAAVHLQAHVEKDAGAEAKAEAASGAPANSAS